MPRRLPPLNALPSFEAAARHLSFSKAADELHVTHGAVSRAIRNLEKHLGVPLFARGIRSVRLTQLGASYAADVRRILDQLAAATLVTSGQQSAVLNVSTLDALASRWLVPRLFRFRRSMYMTTRRSGSRYGRSLSSTAFVTLKMAVLAPMPSAIVDTAATVKTGPRRSVRIANVRSLRSMVMPPTPVSGPS